MAGQQLDFLSVLDASLKSIEIVYQGELGDTLIAEVYSQEHDYIIPIPACHTLSEKQIRTFCTKYIDDKECYDESIT